MNREGPEGRRAKGLWWDKALYLVHGCTPVSEGCGRCWAAAASAMRAHHPNPTVQARNAGLTTGTPPRFNGVVRLDPGPLEKLARAKKPRVWAVWNDLFHEDVRGVFRVEAFLAFRQAPVQTVVILTKRPEKMAEWIPRYFQSEAFQNVFLGTSFEDQPTADERLPHLMKLSAMGWRTVASIEPMRRPVDVSRYLDLGMACPKCGHYENDDNYDDIGADRDNVFCNACSAEVLADFHDGIDGVILGGQTGSGAVPLHPDWVRKVRDDCQEAGVPFYLKSLGPGLGRALDGRTWDGLAWGRGGKA